MLLLLLIMDIMDLNKAASLKRVLQCCSVIWDLSLPRLMLLISPMYYWNYEVKCRIHWKSLKVII